MVSPSSTPSSGDDYAALPVEAKKVVRRFSGWVRRVYSERYFGRFEAVAGERAGHRTRVKAIHITRTIAEEDF